ncbi:hypothetical protein ACU4GD_19600 [Cupriavidus basilensis]
MLRVDSYGQIIEAPNRATIDDQCRHRPAHPGKRRAHGPARRRRRQARTLGTLDLNARRLGGATGNDIDIDASGAVRIDGARSISVNGFWTYRDADPGTDLAADGRPYQVIDQAYLDRKHDDSLKFMGKALANGDLMNRKLAGLRGYADAFHLRPGVEIVSATPDGDLHIDGDIDLSRYRYASVNPHTQQTGVYGSGESGALVLRAGRQAQCLRQPDRWLRCLGAASHAGRPGLGTGEGARALGRRCGGAARRSGDIGGKHLLPVGPHAQLRLADEGHEPAGRHGAGGTRHAGGGPGAAGGQRAGRRRARRAGQCHPCRRHGAWPGTCRWPAACSSMPATACRSRPAWPP